MTATDPLARAAQRVSSTPQTERIPGRTDQVKNAAGGYVFEKSEREKLTDFMILGTTGGTYYTGQDQLTRETTDVVLSAVRASGAEVVALAEDVTTSRPPKAPRNRAALFALAAVSALGDPAGVQAVKRAVPRVARTTDHLAQFFGYRKELKNKATAQGKSTVSGRAFQSAIAAWFTSRDPEAVALTSLKGWQRKTPSREAFTIRDALRLGRPRAVTTEQKVLFGWLAGNITDAKAATVLSTVDSYLKAQRLKTPAEAVALISERNLPWEFIPSELLASPEVWEALAATTGLTAVIRNLARMTRIGTLGPFAAANEIVTKRLTSAEELRRARIHPVDLYLALRVYASGASYPNPRAAGHTWTPVADVLDALDEAWQLSFGYTEPHGRRLVIGVDSSGSMGYQQVTLNGSNLGMAYNVASSVALIMKRLDPAGVHVIEVDTQVHPSEITAKTTLRTVARSHPHGGGTNLSLPFNWARSEDLRVDGFLVITDNETWSGWNHPVQALEQYRSRCNPRARVAVAAMTPTGRTMIDPGVPGVINMAGMDASLPQAVTGFIRGTE